METILHTTNTNQNAIFQCNEVKNSYAMELEGLTHSLQFMKEEGICISDLVTDRHSQVKKYMRTQQEGINHWFDVWHMAKGKYVPEIFMIYLVDHNHFLSQV